MVVLNTRNNISLEQFPREGVELGEVGYKLTTGVS